VPRIECFGTSGASAAVPESDANKRAIAIERSTRIKTPSKIDNLIDGNYCVKKTYPQDQIMTPYERLSSIANYQSTLRPDVTAEVLHQRSVIMSDNEAAKHVQESRSRLFQMFNRRSKLAA
jgi:hypothetical protein